MIGAKNAFRCDSCGERVTTINRDEGMMPYFKNCVSTPGCGGMLQIDPVVEGERPTHVWLIPPAEEVAKMSPAARVHVDRNNGLILEPIKEGMN